MADFRSEFKGEFAKNVYELDHLTTNLIIGDYSKIGSMVAKSPSMAVKSFGSCVEEVRFANPTLESVSYAGVGGRSLTSAHSLQMSQSF